jgi:hypothetical protein
MGLCRLELTYADKYGALLFRAAHNVVQLQVVKTVGR